MAGCPEIGGRNRAGHPIPSSANWRAWAATNACIWYRRRSCASTSPRIKSALKSGRGSGTAQRIPASSSVKRGSRCKRPEPGELDAKVGRQASRTSPHQGVDRRDPSRNRIHLLDRGPLAEDPFRAAQFPNQVGDAPTMLGFHREKPARHVKRKGQAFQGPHKGAHGPWMR